MPEETKYSTVPIWRKANLTVKEAAAYSGIGETTIREMLKSKEMPFSFKVGTKWLINRELFDRYIQELCKNGEV